MTTQAHGAWPMLKHFVRAYPSRSVVVIVALVVASILDGLGLSMLLSMLNLATGETQDPSLPEQLALSFTESLGLTPDTAVLLGLGVGLIAVKAVFVLLANRQVGYTVAHVATDLRLNLIRAITNSQWRYYIAQPVGRLSNALATEAQRASEGFYHGAVMATQFINALIFGALAMLISWQATLIALVCGGVLLGLLHTLISVAGRAGRDQTSLLKQLLSVMTDQLGAIKPLKAMAREGHIDALMSAQTKDLKTALKSQVFSKAALIALQEPLLAILVAVGFFFFVVKMGMNMATVVVMIFLIARAINHLAKAQRAYQHIAISESAYWSLQETTDLALTQREPSQGQQTPTLDDGIVFQDVAFQYDQTPTLEGLNFAIPAHQLTVVTGPSGSGKTTVIDLVAGLLQPTSGEILVDGQPINDLDQRQWRRLIGYVPQEALLVNESVFYNLTLGDDTLTEADAHAALRMANAEHFIAQLEHGIHTPLGERGGRLSGGQRQRLAIARALIQQPKLLILDEATSNLDASSEQAIIETVDKLKGQLTLLAVSHDRPMIDIADQHIELLGGQRQ